jgi:ring-1,2-phenylacetyl-CoA epoxidase subunit PaaD
VVTTTVRGVEWVYELLTSVKDPELPTIDVVELGIVRDVVVNTDSVTVFVTPTYSGCPAMQVIEQDIEGVLRANGFRDVSIRTVYSPPWTSNWVTESGRKKLQEAGIAPPSPASFDGGSVPDLVSLTRSTTGRAIECPFCGSVNTTLRSEFGSTACKAIHFCNACQQPFDSFKPF